MFFSKESTQQRAEDFKKHLHDAIHALNLKQEWICRSLGIGQSCVSSWTDTDSDRHLPAALIPALPIELATEVLQYLARQINVRVNIKPNGMIDDEATDLDVEVGDFIRMFRDPKTPKAALHAQLNKVDAIRERMVAEVDAR